MKHREEKKRNYYIYIRLMLVICWFQKKLTSIDIYSVKPMLKLPPAEKKREIQKSSTCTSEGKLF